MQERGYGMYITVLYGMFASVIAIIAMVALATYLFRRVERSIWLNRCSDVMP